MPPTLSWREPASLFCCSSTKESTRGASRRFLWHFTLLSTGSFMPSTRVWRGESKTPWNGYSTQAIHILRHGFGFTMWIGIWIKDPLICSQIARRVPRRLHCTMRCYVDSVGWPSTRSLLMERMSVPSVVFTEVHCTWDRGG